MTMQPPPPPGPARSPAPVSNPLVTYWKRVVLERYAQFEGRSGRAEFWWYFLAGVIISIVFNVLIAITSFFWVIYVIDKSGWWLLIGLIPLVGIIVLIVFWATEGTPGPNQFGAPDQTEATSTATPRA